MRIGIVIAMEKEFRRVEALLSDRKTISVCGKDYVTGSVASNTLIMVQSGIGKVNAAVGATELIGRFSPDVVVSTGVAGGADVSLNVMEAVVATSSCYHDVYCGKEVAYGQVPGKPLMFESDRTLVEKALSIDCGTKINAGLIVTGDWFVDSRDKMRSIIDSFPDAMAVDMESAAIAHTCHIFGVPFVSFRVISDIPLKDTGAKQYFDFWETMADNSFKVTQAFLEKL